MHARSTCVRTLFGAYASLFGASRRMFLNRDARNERANLRNEHGEHPTYQNQAFLAHTGNVTYDDHVLDSLNKIPPTVRVV